MKTILALFLSFALIFGATSPQVYGEPHPIQGDIEQTDTVELYKRGGYRSPKRSYNPGIQNPARTTPGTPGGAYRNPATPRTGFGRFFGGLFGGLALGSIIGSLFNPFAGFSLGVPFLSLLSLVFWVVVIWIVVRLFRRRKQNNV